MNFKGSLLSLSAMVASFAPAAAFADHDDDFDDEGVEVHVHDDSCGHHGTPVGQPSDHGRYELRSVQKWVPGYYEQVWVPRICKQRSHGRWGMKCWGGRYDSQWHSGRYDTVQEWVWVPSARLGASSGHGSSSVSFQVSGSL